MLATSATDLPRIEMGQKEMVCDECVANHYFFEYPRRDLNPHDRKVTGF